MTAKDEPTKAELLEEAKEHDIAGRSSMTKDELAEALEEVHEDEPKNEKADEDSAEEVPFDVNDQKLDLPEEGSKDDDGTLSLPRPYDYKRYDN